MTDMKGVENRRDQAWALRCQGKSYPAIAHALGCSVGTAFNLVSRTEKEAHERLAETAINHKLQHLEQVDYLRERAFRAFDTDPTAQNMTAALKCIDMERKILRLDDERQAYLDARFMDGQRRQERQWEETGRRLAQSIEACFRADDEARMEHAKHDSLIGEMCRAIEVEKHEAIDAQPQEGGASS